MIIDAVSAGVQVFVVDDPVRRKHLKKLLDKNGLVLSELIASHLVRCVAVEESYLLSGEMRAERAVAFFESVILEAKARGIEGILIIGNSGWLGDCSNDPELLEQVSNYEASLDQLVARYTNVSIVCPYAAELVDAHVMVQAFAKHGAITVGSAARV